MSPVLSIVTGTYNRLGLLRRMLDSARMTIPPTIPYEFVIIDGGSTDDTLPYLRAQSDVVLIEHGQLRGAIKAFCDGARMAHGEYVLLANDDVVFFQGAILRSLVYLETHAHCGAVAFMDNRPAVAGGSTEYSVKLQPAIAPDGQSASVPYAQVGLVRRWLGELCGWWGDRDPIMSQALTYGGDNYLSSRIWELGYTVDVVKGVKVHDHIIEDELRERNRRARDHAFYQLYPRGPQIAELPTVASPQAEQLRILYLPIYEPGPLHNRQVHNKVGLKKALQKRGLVWEIDYMADPVDLYDSIEMFQPHIILSQIHETRYITRPMLEEFRRRMPGVLIVNWNGDARGLTAPAYLDLLRAVDLQLVVNAAPLAEYARLGIRAAYWQIGIETGDGGQRNVPAHDVVFLGTCYSDQRREMEAALRRISRNVGLYGMGWQQSNGECLYDFASGEALYRAATIAIGDTFPDTLAFVSNRTIQALAAGAFLLQQRSERLEDYTGLVAGEHYIVWSDIDDLTDKVRYWLAPERAQERSAIAAAGYAFIHAHYNFDVLVQQFFEELLPLIEAYKDAERA